MHNQQNAEKAIRRWMPQTPDVWDECAHQAVKELDNAGLLMPDLPEPTDTWGTWGVDGLEVNAADKDGEVRIEWEDESDYAYYGKQTRTIWLNRDQVIAILAAADYAEKGENNA